jgi:soluble lytic murein transglycosylase-like protein
MRATTRNLLIFSGIGLVLWFVSRQSGVGSEVGSVISSVERAVGAWKYDPRGNDYDAAFTQAERAWNLPEGMLRRVAWQESRFNAGAKSPAGAQGLMQFMPATASQFGINPFDPVASINAAAKYFAQLYISTGNWSNALGAYNWGVGNIQRKGLASAPAETQQYVASITSDLNIV